MTDPNGATDALPADVLPAEDNDVVFDAPWQARAFGLVVALYDDEDRDWASFQHQLVDNLDGVDPDDLDVDVEGVYYREWLASLEDLLVKTGTLSREEIDRRQREFSVGERDASEFVEGETDH